MLCGGDKDLRHFLLSLSFSKGLSANSLTTALLLDPVVASVHLRVRKQRLTSVQNHTLQKDAGLASFLGLCPLGGEREWGFSANALVWERRQGKG